MIWYVNSKLNSGTSDGRSLRTAFASLQQALDHAKAGDTILIAPGAYDQDLAARVSAARARTNRHCFGLVEPGGIEPPTS